MRWSSTGPGCDGVPEIDIPSRVGVLDRLPDAAVSGAPRRGGPRTRPGTRSGLVRRGIVKGGGEDVLRLWDRGTDPRHQRLAIQPAHPLMVAWSNPVGPTSKNPRPHKDGVPAFPAG